MGKIFLKKAQIVPGLIHKIIAETKPDLKALQTVTIEESGKRFAIRSQCQGGLPQSLPGWRGGGALPPPIREL